MDPRRIHGVYFFDARDFLAYRISGQLVDQLAESGILLRRTADYGERPNRVGSGVYFMHLHHRKRMDQAIIPQVIAERSLRLGFAGVNLAGDHEIGLIADAIAVHVAVAESAPA
ncbi:hypothetical protein D1872_293450 [compost metagenome]